MFIWLSVAGTDPKDLERQIVCLWPKSILPGCFAAGVDAARGSGETCPAGSRFAKAQRAILRPQC